MRTLPVSSVTKKAAELISAIVAGATFCHGLLMRPIDSAVSTPTLLTRRGDMANLIRLFAALTATSCLPLSALLSQTRSTDPPAQNSHDSSAEAAEEAVRHEVEQQRQSLEREAKKTLDPDAVVVMEETHNAIKAVESNNNAEAAEVIRRALERLQRLLTRNRAPAEIAVDIKVEIFDAAPTNSTSIIEIAQDASRAFDDKDFPSARCSTSFVNERNPSSQVQPAVSNFS